MLSGWEYIVSKQFQWANNNIIPLIGINGEMNRPTFTRDLKIFEPFLEENRNRFQQGK